MTVAIKNQNTSTVNKKTLKVVGLTALAVLLIVSSILLIRFTGERSDKIDYDKYRDEMLRQLQDNKGEYDAQSIILNQTTEPFANELAQRLNAELRITTNGHFATLTLPEGITIEDICHNDEFLKDLPRMSIDYMARVSEIIEFDSDGKIPSPPIYTVTDGSYVLQQYLNYINLQNVWNYTLGEYVTVAVIDTGIDTDHPEFKGRISEYSYNASEDKVVRDHILPGGGYDWSLIEDEYGHGTAVAGVIASSMNNGEIVGVAPKVELLVIKADCNKDGVFKNSSDLVFGLYYAIEKDVDVVNMSFGNYLDNYYEAPAQLAKDSDIICVAAAGNDSSAVPVYPAADANVIGVGALGANSWSLAEYSNFGESVDIVAPGTTYTATIGGGYTIKNGTSLASPIVAGAVALYLAAYPIQEYDDVCEVLYASSYDIGTPGPDWYYGYGALDVNAFILEERGTVKFNMMCDDLETLDRVFIREHTLQNIPEPERLYAVFDGWYYDPQFTEEYNLYEDMFTGNLTLYAKWVNEDDGIPFTYTTLDDGTIEILSYTGHRKYITIPNYIEGKVVSSIGENAFANITFIRQVNLPKNLRIIKSGAFSGCSNIITVELPDSVEIIESNAFEKNVRLSSFVISSNSKLQTIGNNAFENCSHLRTFFIPSNLKELNGSAFNGAISIMSFSVHEGNAYFKTSDGVLFNKNMDTLVAYPAGKNGEYSIPSGVKTIGDYAFAYAHITGIDLSGIESIGQYGFANTWLEALVISDGVKKADIGAFIGTAYLKSVTIGKGLNTIASKLFYASAIESIYIPSNIESIDDAAFFGNNLTSISFAKDSRLESIGANAFSATQLKTITFPKSLKTIKKSAFELCLVLTNVKFEEGSQITTIGKMAFGNCASLVKSELPDGLQTIGEFAFWKTSLTEVIIPASVNLVEGGAFASCQSLTNIKVADESAYYDDVDGVLYDKSHLTLVGYPAGNKRSTYNVLSGVKVIGKNAFYGSYNVKNVILPESLEELSSYALYDSGIETIAIPDNVISVGRYAFGNDYGLRSIIFGEASKLSRISYAAFANCGIKSFRVPASVNSIAQEAFIGCENLTEITFAKNSALQSISAYMFKGCNNLTSIVFENGSSLTSIQAHGLEGMRKLKNLDFGDAKLTNIDNFAFRFCESLERFEVPDGVTYVGRYAFYYCTSLTELLISESVEYIGRFVCLGANKANIYFKSESLPKNLQEDWDYGLGGYYLGVTDVLDKGDWKYALLTNGGIGIIKYNGNETSVDMTKLQLGGEILNIGGGAFANGTLKNVVLPETVKIIQAEAFYSSALESVIIPKNVTFIGRKAFADTPIKTLIFASGSVLTTIEQSAFENTKSLKTVTLPTSLEKMGRGAFSNSGIESIVFEDAIKLTEIPESAFSYTKLRTLTLPDTISLINHNAFRNTELLESVNFGNGEMMIMNHAFYQSGLRTLTIPKNVTYIGEYAFVALTNLNEFKVESGNKYYKAVDGLLLGDSERKLIAVPAGRKGELTVPQSIEVIGFGAFESTSLSSIKFDKNANILSFGYRAFYNANSITEITVPSSVVSIDYYAFAMCRNLENVTFEEGSRLAGIYEGAFYGCDKLSDILLPDVLIEISDFSFYGCKSLTKIPVSEHSELKGIFDYAMAYTGLKGELNTPKSLTDIGNYAFSGTKITSLNIPTDNAWELLIGLGAFNDCNSLKEVTLPFIGASYENLNISWFGYIFGAGSPAANDAYIPNSLEKVKISDGITLLATNSFIDIEKLVYIDLPSTITSIYPHAFISTIDNPRGVAFELKNKIHFVDMSGKQVTTITNEYLSHTNIFGRLDIAEGVEVIDYSAFYVCQGLSSVSIPEGVKRIEGFAFDGIGAITITLPSTLEYIGEFAFQSNGFEEIRNNSSIQLHLGSSDHGQVAINAKVLIHKDGSVEYKDGFSENICIETPDHFKFTIQDNEYVLLGYSGAERTVILPKNIFGQKYTINWAGGAENIIIPGELGEINERAFSGRGAPSIKSIVIEEGITRIGYGAFMDCRNMVEITLPSSLVEIGGDAFSSCRRLKYITIPENVKTIHSHAFNNCQLLKALHIPANVEYIGNGVFAGCNELSLSVSNKNKNFRIIKDILYDKNAEKILYIPSSVTELEVPKTVNDITSAFEYNQNILFVYFEEGSRLTEIGSSAFYGCRNLRNVEIPDSVTAIRSSAFSECVTLTSIKLPSGLKTIEGQAFANCDKLSDIEIPSGVTFIGDSAFHYCKSIKEIRIPNGITKIHSYTFNGCSSLSKINIPDSVTEIDGNPFIACPIIDLEISKSHPYFTYLDGVVYNKDLTEAVFATANVTKAVIPASVTKLNNAFRGSFVLDVSFEKGSKLTRIETGDFNDCRLLNKFTIPASVTYIEELAFNQLEFLRYIVNNSDLNINFDSHENGTIGSSAKVIVNKYGSKKYAVGYDNFDYIDTPDGFRYISHNGNYTMISYLGNEETVTLPLYFNGKKYSINHLSGVTNVIVPEGVERIEIYSFAQNPLLKSVKLPESLLYIDGTSFDGSGIEHIEIPKNVISIGDYAFSACHNLKSVVLPVALQRIEGWAFSNCISLESINLPDTLTSIGENCFIYSKIYNNPDNWIDGSLYIGTNLIEANPDSIVFEVPSSVTCIAYGAFDKCYTLKEISIGKAADGLLMNVSNLETLRITEMPQKGIKQYFEVWGQITLPLTLKNIVLSEGVRMNDTAFDQIESVTIFVDQLKKDTMWDENFPGWNNHNRVIYSDQWITVYFHNADKSLLRKDIFLTSQVIRQPWINDYTIANITYVFTGYDIDGDGKADFIPANSTIDLSATAVYENYDTCQLNGHQSGGWIEEVPSTCTRNGVEKQYCSVCSTLLGSREVSVSDHIRGEWVTDEAQGIIYVECIYCHTRLDEKDIGGSGNSDQPIEPPNEYPIESPEENVPSKNSPSDNGGGEWIIIVICIIAAAVTVTVAAVAVTIIILIKKKK